jgi:hypothetical protein
MAFNALRWFPRFEGEVDAPAFGPEYAWRSERAADWIDRYRRGPRLQKELEKLTGGITSNDYKEFELALETLGTCLGFESVRPNDKADPDCAWREGSKAWLLWEAKTMEHPDSPLSPRDTRQASSHRNWVKRKLAWPDPETSITIIVSSRAEVDPTAIAICDPDVCLVSPDVVRGIAARAVEVLTTAGAEAPGLTAEQLQERIAELFAQHSLGTSEITNELTTNSVFE